MNLSDLRQEYQKSELTWENIRRDPFLQFQSWFEEAMHAQILEPNAMSLATVARDGQPSLRTVLLKYFDEKGFVFFTNYESRKSQEIGGNPQVALLFPWFVLERQVCITGVAERVSTVESMKYFATRPRGSQLGAWVSQQSSVISSRQLLMMKLDELKRKFKDGEIPIPAFWGGFRVVPKTFEFWQGRENRLHDRFFFQKTASGTWDLSMLSP
jgi:pyridoxamine 5'-phosphate oxidase